MYEPEIFAPSNSLETNADAPCSICILENKKSPSMAVDNDLQKEVVPTAEK